MSDLAHNPDLYIHVPADCQLVKGACRSALYDLSGGELLLFPNDYLPLLEQFSTHPIGELLRLYSTADEREFLQEFVDYLDSQDMIVLLPDTALFPDIPEGWDFPGRIQNALIDYNGTVTDMPSVFRQLDGLGCQFLQVRCFDASLKPDLLSEWMPHLQHTSLKSVEVILKHDPAIPLEAYVSFMEQHPLIARLVLHSAEEDRQVLIDYGHTADNSPGIERSLLLITAALDSELHCGHISMGNLNSPQLPVFMEHKDYNGCLNRKISIDPAGNIRNCPSMKTAYGNIKEVSLLQALEAKGFTDLWGLHKDQVNVCRDCEFRYVCSDCRAYLDDPGDIYSKPLKCGYDPYSATWEEWRLHSLKQFAIQYYGL